MYSIEAGRAEALGELRRQRIVYEEGHVPVSSLPSMARERLCWAPWTGPTNGRRVSRVTSYLYTPPTRSAVPDDARTLRCQAPPRADRPGSRPYPARRSSTWSGAFRPRLRSSNNRSQPPDVPVAGRELHATRGAREGATGGGNRASGVTPREVPGGCGGGEAEGWKRRSDRALGPTRSSR